MPRQFGPFSVDTPLVLAPMAGVSDRVYRQLCLQHGASWAPSEMTSADLELRQTEQTRRRLDLRGEHTPQIVQIAGADPQEMADAAQAAVALGAACIDINMGCPAKRVCHRLAGSALLRDEALVGQILAAVVQAVAVPVTLKTRTGWSPETRNAVRIARIAEDAGIAGLSLHGRTRACAYQGEAEYDFPICPEFERPVKAVVDWIETRADLDAGRVGIWGVSFGGYYAPRAAAFEKRIKACVSLSGAFQRKTTFEGRPVINVEAFRVRSGSKDLEEAGQVAARVSLADCAKDITCPIYILAGTKDRLTGVDQASKLAAAVSGPVTLSIIEGGNHVVNNYWYTYRDQTADWMATQLGVPKR